MTQRWVCESCGEPADEAGACEACDGARVDAESEDGRAKLEAAAVEERRAWSSRLTTYSLPVGLLAGLGLGMVLPSLPVPGGQPIVALVLAVAATWLAREGLAAVMTEPGRFASFAPPPPKRTAARVAGAVLVAGALGALGYAWQQRQNEERAAAEAQRAGRAWANLWQCALGGPAGDREVVSRARLVALETQTEGWPARCNAHADAVFTAVRDGRYGADLVEAMRNRFSCDTGCQVKDPATQFVGLLALGTGLPHANPTVEAPVALDARPYARAMFLPIGGAFDAVRQARDARPDGTVRLHLDSRSRGHQLCELKVANGTVECDRLEVGARARRVALLQGPEALFELTIGADTQTIDAQGQAITTWGGRREGHALTGGEDGVVLHRIEEGRSVDTQPLDLDAGASAWLEAEHVLWTTPVEEGARLSARAVEKDGLGDAVDIGVLPDDTRLQRCTAGLTDHWLFGDRPDRFRIVSHDGSGWSLRRPAGGTRKGRRRPPSAPAPSTAPAAAASAADFGVAGLLQTQKPDDEGGFGALPEASGRDLFTEKPPARAATTATAKRAFAAARGGLPRYALSCRPEGAEVTWREADGDRDRIVQLVCRAEGCERRETTLEGLDVDAWWLATALGPERTLIVWRRTAGDLRMRLAPLDELGRAKGEMLLDRAAFGGPKTANPEAFIGPSSVALLFEGRGVHGLWMDRLGHRRPLGSDDDRTPDAPMNRPRPGGPAPYHQQTPPPLPH